MPVRPIPQGPLAKGGEMSAYSCINISRGFARTYLITYVLNATDDQLVRLLDGLLQDRLYMVSVVSNEIQNDDELLK